MQNLQKFHFYNMRKKIFDPLAWWLSKKELHYGMEKASSNVDEIFEFSENYLGRGFYARIHSYQNPSEIISLGRLVKEINPETILEIGTHKGGTFFMWCRISQNLRFIASIDLPGGKYGGGYVKARERLLREFIYDRYNTKMCLIRDDSHKKTTYKLISSSLKKQNLDFLFIDGDHSYEGVKQDFELYSPFVKSGLIAFHDIVHESKEFGVKRFWSELKRKYHTKELIGNDSNKGIGVVFIP